jgi:hypothetical protein
MDKSIKHNVNGPLSPGLNMNQDLKGETTLQ